jgi:hypothetical protein
MKLRFLDRIANHQYPLMRQPDQLPRCYELTDQERLQKVKEWNNRNVWNTPDLSEQDLESTRYYGA